MRSVILLHIQLLFNILTDNFSGSDLEKLKKAEDIVQKTLGISKYPFKNENIQDINFFKKAIREDGSNLFNLINSLSYDLLDGYIDDNETLSFFPYANNNREIKSIKYTLDKQYYK